MHMSLLFQKSRKKIAKYLQNPRKSRKKNPQKFLKFQKIRKNPRDFAGILSRKNPRIFFSPQKSAGFFPRKIRTAKIRGFLRVGFCGFLPMPGIYA